jgi:hypothetical protein
MAYSGDGGKLAMTRTIFDSNFLFADNYGAAVVEADAAGGSAVRLQECTFAGKPPGETLPRLLADNRGVEEEAVFYSDSEDPVVCVYEGAGQVEPPPECKNDVPKVLQESADKFLSGCSAWLITIQEVRNNQFPTA